MLSKKLTVEIVKTFSGEGDVVAWLKKVRLVAKLQKIDDLASFLPLYLEGDALNLYLEMKEEDQADAAKIEARLKAAFTEGSIEAWVRLGKKRWVGEQVDVYVNEIRRLAGLAGYEGDGLERTVKLAFVSGFPDTIATALERVKGFKTLPVSDLVEEARILAAKSSHGAGVISVASGEAVGTGSGIMREDVAAMVVKGSGGAYRRSQGGGGVESTGKREEPRNFKGRCFRCEGPHRARDCREPRPPIVCFRCNEEGHIAAYCKQGNGKRGTAAPAATPLME